MRYRWYADNSEMAGARGAAIHDIFLLGGVSVTPEVEKQIFDAVVNEKAKLGCKDLPLKWNLKDLKSDYETAHCREVFERILSNSKAWRKGIMERCAGYPFTIFVACVESHSIERKIIKLRKQSLSQYAFANALQRVALYARAQRPDNFEVTLDWPDKADPRPFVEEYRSAYLNGHTVEGHSYHSGPLQALQFADSPAFTPMNSSVLLQFTDIVVGAVREFIEFSLGKRGEDSVGVDIAKLLKGRFYGAPRTIPGWGICISSDSADFRAKIRQAVRQHLQ